MFWVRWVLGVGDFVEGFDGFVEPFGGGLDIGEGALRFREGVHELGDLHLDESDVELEVDLLRGEDESTAGIVEGGFHGGDGFVLFALEEVDATKTGEDLRSGGAVFVKGSFILRG